MGVGCPAQLQVAFESALVELSFYSVQDIISTDPTCPGIYSATPSSVHSHLSRECGVGSCQFVLDTGAPILGPVAYLVPMGLSGPPCSTLYLT